VERKTLTKGYNHNKVHPGSECSIKLEKKFEDDKEEDNIKKKSQMTKKMIESKRELFEYFEDDDIDHLKDIDDEFFYYDDIVVFSYSQYFEFFIIHLLSFVILGPFIALYTYIFRGNPELMYNL
jgi:hypothetical protein